jgi:hypothetical protein
MGTAGVARRPFGVTLIGVIGVIQGILVAIAGLALAIENDNADLLRHVGRTDAEVLGTGIGLLVVGLITLLVAWALLRGSNFARWLIGIIEIFHLASGVYLLFGYDGAYLWDGVVYVVIAVVVLYLLFGSARSEEFFEGRAVRG